jgi:hypothetical protein
MQIEKTYHPNFPIEAVCAAWVSSNRAILPATRMDLIPEVGGHYRLTVEMPDFKGKTKASFSQSNLGTSDLLEKPS